MEFYDVLAQVINVLQREGRTSYRAIKRQFNLDDAYLDDLKVELIEVKQLAVDQDGTMLLWTGGSSLAPAPVRQSERPPLTYTPAHLTAKILASRAALAGERKQVTVLFADIKDSTELIKDLDPEAAQQLLDPAIHRMMDAVHRFEGTVNQVLGDGIMALFGAPLAHEDHALRAGYAALAMQAAMHGYTEEVRRAHGLELRIRVGLNSGEVVVRTIGNDLHMDYSAVGQTTHLAARMEQLATPGSIRLTPTTLRLVEGFVQVNALGPVPVKGLTDPVEVFELLGASAIRRRLQAAAARGLTPFVGRQQELTALYQALDHAGAGHGQLVAIVGEAGVGKSRLVWEVTHSHRTQEWLVLEGSSVSYGKATAYLPVIDLFKDYFQIDDRDDQRRRREKITGKLLTLDEALRPTLSALLALLEVPVEDPQWQALDPPQRRQRTLDALKRVLLRESQVQPLLLVFEDLHWIDAETQALLDSLVESLPTARLLLLVNYRPEYQHGWGSKTYYTQLRLDPLPPASAEDFLRALMGDNADLEPLKQLLIARTEGNPFFLEESVRTLVETGVLVGEPGAYRLAPNVGAAPRDRPPVGNHREVPLPPEIHIPPTVQAVLAARIDRLPPEEKRLLQTAAVVGTEVPFSLLQAITDLLDDALHRGLTHLQAAEFLYETSLYPERAYTFKHALTHEVAYNSLLHERRRTLHAQIVAAVEQLYAEQLAEQVERLAHHALRGAVWDKALTYSRQAGARAFARSANREAVLCFEQALDALQHLPESRDTMEHGIDVRFDLRNVLLALGEFGPMLDHLRQAETLAETLDDHRRLGRLSAYMAQYFNSMGDPDSAIAACQRALTFATSLGDMALQVGAQQHLGHAYSRLGDYRRAMEFLRQNVASLEGEQQRERFGRAGLPAVLSRVWLTRCLAELGEFVEGRSHGEEGVRLAETVAQPFSLVGAYGGIGYLHLRKGNLDQAIPVLERGLALCQVTHLGGLFPLIASPLGAAYALSGRLAEALSLLEQTVEQTTAMGTMGHQSLLEGWLSEAYLLASRLQDATAQAWRALELARTHKERGYEAWVLRLLGEIAMHGDPPDVEPAAASYRQALTLAEELGMRPLQAHCHLGLGTLYARTGQAVQAGVELSAALTLYRAMDMTFWLPQAETALAQVTATR